MAIKWTPENDEEVVDTLVWAGASQYEWYHALDNVEGSNVVSVAMETGDYDEEGEPLIRPLITTTDELVALVNAIIAEKRAGWMHILRAVEKEDFDSIDADIVFQHAVLGDIVFG